MPTTGQRQTLSNKSLIEDRVTANEYVDRRIVVISLGFVLV